MAKNIRKIHTKIKMADFLLGLELGTKRLFFKSTSDTCAYQISNI